jgi:O-antigen/teichoic acid export membrane protein
VLGTAIITSVVFLLPVNEWLGIKLSRGIVDTTLYLLGLQILMRMLMGLIGGSFLVIGVSYRGNNWNSAASLAITLSTASMAFMHASFAWIAAQQALMVTLFCALALFDLWRKAPQIIPRLQFAKPNRIGEILKQSGYFGLLFWANFLVYQLPLILMQRILGPSSVVVFSITRTIYSMSRQALSAITQALGQEITELYGKHALTRLFRLYELSERVIFAMIPVVSTGTLLATPVLIAVWLHKPTLYDPYVCIIMALISGVMGIKEHRYQFQTSTNHHTALAHMTFWTYLAMVAIEVPGIHLFGVMGFLVPWFITEVVQVLFILRLNRRLFVSTTELDFSPVYKLFALMGLAVLLGSWFAIHAQQKSLLQASVTAMVFVMVLALISYPLFHVGDVRIYLRDRMALRNQKSA